jgi:hypothetical protein
MQWFEFQIKDRFFDKNSIYHFLYGFILGIICYYLHFFWIGIILLIPIELIFHYAIGYPKERIKLAFTSKNALTDLSLAYLGYLLFFIIM